MSPQWIYTIVRRDTGRVYVGKTGAVKARWDAHKYAARHRRTPLAIDMSDLGFEAFDFKVIGACDDPVAGSVAEREAIQKFAAEPAGVYNSVVPYLEWEKYLTNAEREQWDRATADINDIKATIAVYQSASDEIRRKAVQRARNALNKKARAAMGEQS